MTSTKTVDIDITIKKLQTEIKYANRGTFTTCKVALLEMAVRALEQQQAQLAALQTGEHIGLAVTAEVTSATHD